MPRGPHTSTHPNYTWGNPGINILIIVWVWGGGGWQSVVVLFFLDPGATFSALTENPDLLSSLSATIMGQSGWNKWYYLSHSLSCNWDSVLFFSWDSDTASLPHPFWGGGILTKLQDSVFMNMEPTLSFPLIEQNVNPKVWADGKTMGKTKNAVPVIIKLKDPHQFPH